MFPIFATSDKLDGSAGTKPLGLGSEQHNVSWKIFVPYLTATLS